MNYFRPDYWLNENDKLIFLDDRRYNDDYGGVVKCSTIVKSLSSFYKAIEYDAKSHFLIIKCEYRGRTICMLDCDNLEDAKTASDYLVKNKIDYATFVSSIGKRWYFPGMSFSSFEAAHNFAKNIPGCDSRYLKMSQDIGYFVVRGESKENVFLPKLILSNVKEPTVKEFVKNLDNHFRSDILTMIIRLRMVAGWTNKIYINQKFLT